MASFVLTLSRLCMCSVFWLLLVKLSVLAKWSAKWLLWGSLTVVRRLSPQSPDRLWFSV